MSKNTPGPWFSIEGSIKHSNGAIASAWLPREIDETRLDGESWIDMRKRTQPERDSRDAEMIANARLISAAPELLEALEVAYMSLCDMICADDGQAWKEAEKAIPKIVAAIEKARGEA